MSTVLMDVIKDPKDHAALNFLFSRQILGEPRTQLGPKSVFGRAVPEIHGAAAKATPS